MKCLLFVVGVLALVSVAVDATESEVGMLEQSEMNLPKTVGGYKVSDLRAAVHKAVVKAVAKKNAKRVVAKQAAVVKKVKAAKKVKKAMKKALKKVTHKKAKKSRREEGA